MASLARLGATTKKEALRHRKRDVALTVLAEFDENLTEEEEVVIRRAIRGIKPVPFNLITTYPGRYSKLDEILIDEICQRFTEQPINVHDMAASNAITSVELFESLSARVNIRSFRASDYATVISVANVGYWRVIFDQDEEALQFVGRSFVIQAFGPISPVNRFIKAMVADRLVKKARLVPDDQRQHISLFHPRARALDRRSPHFNLARDDLLDPAPATYEVVRVMMSTERWPKDSFKKAARAIMKTVADRGLLIMGHHFMGHDSSPRSAMTIWEKRGQSLQHVRDVNGGHDLKDVIESAALES